MNKRGMFWIAEEKVLISTYVEEGLENLSRNSSPYSQKKLWERVRPERNFRKYDYYPRGRVDYDSSGRPVIILGKSVKKSFIPAIQEAFEITDKPQIVLDQLKRYDSEKDRVKDRETRRKRAKRSRRIDTLE